jgi:RimJ/RimL family protein N-acetyltransferase
VKGLHQTAGVPVVPSTLRTRRLTLTPLDPDDADAMVDVLNDERMYEFTGGQPLTLDQLRWRYRRLAVGHSSDQTEQWLNWIVRMTVDQDPVGALQATVSVDGASADVAWEVGVPWQRRGIASEAATAVVDWLIAHDVSQVRALIHPRHVASTRVAARAGLEPTEERVDGEVVWRWSAR